MSGELAITSTCKLHTGRLMPVLGFGCGGAIKEESIKTAIDVGYRHLDSARRYKSDHLIAEAVTTHPSLDRSSFFLTTKIWDCTAEDTVETILPVLRDSVRKMQPVNDNPYVDLFLIHQPIAGPEGRLKLWKALIELQKLGETKDIGVSNFSIKHLEALKATGVKPVSNQLELHPWCQQRELVKHCQDNGIILQACAPLVRNRKAEDPVAKRIAEECSKEVAQVLVRWCLQKGYVPLPKSDTTSRIQSNANVFDFSLSDAQMKELDALGDGGDAHITLWTLDLD